MIETATTAISAILASGAFIWTASIIILIAMTFSLEFEREGWATTFFSLGIALFLWNFRSEIWEVITSNPTATIGFAVSYVLIGIVWSFLKWRTYVKNIFDKFKTTKIEFIATNKVIDSSNRHQFNSILNQKGFKNEEGSKINIKSDDTFEEIALKITPLASKKKSVITAWISYWPVSIAGTLLNNPFRQFFEWVFANVSGFYGKITKRYQTDAFGA